MIRGFSLVELLATLTLAAVLAAIAYPGFATWLLDNRRNAAVATAMHAVHAARQFAATRGESMQLCGATDAAQCSGGLNWSSGLLLVNELGTVHRSLPLARSVQELTVRSNRPAISFEPGTSFASPATLTICDRRGSGAARAVIVSRSGRPRVSDHDASNRELRC